MRQREPGSKPGLDDDPPVRKCCEDLPKYLVEAERSTEAEILGHRGAWNVAELDHAAACPNTVEAGLKPGDAARGLDRDIEPAAAAG